MFENEMHGIDSTGYSTEYHSHYYDKRVREFGLKKKRIYMKSTIITELKLQIIVSFKLELNFRHDSLDFPKALKNVPIFIIKKSKYIIGDKGYDSEYNQSTNKINSIKEVIMKFLVYNIHRIIKDNKNIINYYLKRISLGY